MGKIVVTEFVSLDGVIEAPGGGEDYKHGGWTFEIDRGTGGRQVQARRAGRGRRAAAGPRHLRGLRRRLADDGDGAGFAEKMNEMPKYVVSSTLTEAEWDNSTVLRGDLADEVAKLQGLGRRRDPRRRQRAARAGADRA